MNWHLPSVHYQKPWYKDTWLQLLECKLESTSLHLSKWVCTSLYVGFLQCWLQLATEYNTERGLINFTDVYQNAFFLLASYQTKRLFKNWYWDCREFNFLLSNVAGGISGSQWRYPRDPRRSSTLWHFWGTSSRTEPGGQLWPPCLRTTTMFCEFASRCGASSTCRSTKIAFNGSATLVRNGTRLCRTSRCLTRAPFSPPGRTFLPAVVSASAITRQRAATHNPSDSLWVSAPGVDSQAV